MRAIRIRSHNAKSKWNHSHTVKLINPCEQKNLGIENRGWAISVCVSQNHINKVEGTTKVWHADLKLLDLAAFWQTQRPKTKTDLSWTCRDGEEDNRCNTKNYTGSAELIVRQQVAVEPNVKSDANNDFNSIKIKHEHVQGTQKKTHNSHSCPILPKSGLHPRTTRMHVGTHTHTHAHLYRLICILIKWGHDGCWDSILQSTKYTMTVKRVADF